MAPCAWLVHRVRHPGHLRSDARASTSTPRRRCSRCCVASRWTGRANAAQHRSPVAACRARNCSTVAAHKLGLLTARRIRPAENSRCWRICRRALEIARRQRQRARSERDAGTHLSASSTATATATRSLRVVDALLNDVGRRRPWVGNTRHRRRRRSFFEAQMREYERAPARRRRPSSRNSRRRTWARCPTEAGRLLRQLQHRNRRRQRRLESRTLQIVDQPRAELRASCVAKRCSVPTGATPARRGGITGGTGHAVAHQGNPGAARRAAAALHRQTSRCDRARETLEAAQGAAAGRNRRAAARRCGRGRRVRAPASNPGLPEHPAPALNQADVESPSLRGAARRTPPHRRRRTAPASRHGAAGRSRIRRA